MKSGLEHHFPFQKPLFYLRGVGGYFFSVRLKKGRHCEVKDLKEDNEWFTEVAGTQPTAEQLSAGE